MTDQATQATIRPATPQWLSWRKYLVSIGRDEIVARMDRAEAAGRAMKVPKPWPNDEARQKAEEGAEAVRPQTPLSPGAQWLNLYGSAETPLIDARGSLAKAGLRPSDTLVAVLTRTRGPLSPGKRWPADEFMRAAPAMRVGEHVDVEFERAGELRTAVVIAYGAILGKPEELREEDCTPFLLAHPTTRRQLLSWWAGQHPEAPELAETALKAMSPKELQQATLLMDMGNAQPAGSRHQVAYDSFAAAWKLSR
jgi:hypothetical protein